MSRSIGTVSTGVVLLIASVVSAGDDVLRLGGSFSVETPTAIEAILRDPESHHDRRIRIEGRIASVCTQEGCFIEVVPLVGGGDGIVVNFPGLSNTFPLDCAGREAVVEGRFYRKIFPSARVHHWQHHSFRPGIPIPEYAVAYRMDVVAAEIRGGSANPPPPAPLQIASGDRLDLDVMGFEAEGFGIDRRSIRPGEVVPRPSTGGNRWMVIVREGEVGIHRADGEVIALESGALSFIEGGLGFEVHNPGEAVAVFDLIYARRIEPEDPHHR